MAIGDVVRLDPIRVELDLAALLDQPPFARWRRAQSGTAIEARVQRLGPKVEASIEPRGLYRVEPVADAIVHRYDPPAELVSGAYILTGILTLGEDPEATRDLDSRFDGLVWDALENAALQAARETMLESIRSELPAEWNTTRVYAPGTRDDGWPLERRQYHFEALPAEQIDCRLTGPVTEPRKTLTFAVGLGPDVEQAEFLLSCADCDILATCPYAGAKTTA